jgi:beta-lactamase regulating signal transducer with metallopeptidase domain/peroxiredoxin
MPFATTGLILDVLLKGAALLALVHATAWAARRFNVSARTRRLLWGLGAAGLLLLPFGSLVLPGAGGQAVDRVARAGESEAGRVPADLFAHAQRDSTRQEEARKPVSPASDSSSAAPAAGPPAGSGDPPASSTSAPSLVSLLRTAADGPLLLLVWGAGAGLLLLRMGAGAARSFRACRQSKEAGAEWEERAREACRRLGIARPVRVRVHPDVSTPMTLGVLHPTILLPERSTDWSEARSRIVLRHELQHLSQGDVGMGVLALAARAVHWPNPLAWRALRGLRRSQEAACDEALLEAGVSPSRYAEALVGLAREAVEAPSGGRMAAWARGMARPSRLEERVGTILSGGAAPAAADRPWRLSAAALAVGAAVALAALRPLPAPVYESAGAGGSAASADAGAAPAQVALEGRLRGAGGTPLANVDVQVTGPGLDSTIATGPEGRFEASVPHRGRYYVSAQPPSHRGAGTLVTEASAGATVRWSPRLRERRTAVDSAFVQRIDAAWEAVEENGGVGKADSLQRAFAERFYRYHRRHPDTKTGLRAVTEALKMWGNVGAADRVEAVLQRTDTGSRIWKAGINYGLSISYAMSSEQDMEDLLHVLQDLRNEVVHPRGRAALLYTLGRIFHWYDPVRNPSRARHFYRRSARLEADPKVTETARENRRELKVLTLEAEAPAVRGRTLDGDQVSLSELEGKAVALWFWAPGHGYPEKSIRVLKKMRDRYREDGLRIVGIARSDSASAARRAVRKHDLPWPQILQRAPGAESFTDYPIAKAYNVRAMTSTYLIDRSGYIAAKHLLSDDIEEAVHTLMQNG